MTAEHQTITWALPPDYPIDDLERVIPILSEADLLLPGYRPPEIGLYHPPHSPSRKNVFKDKNSKDRTAAIAGVRNAAWDITHLSDFIRLVNESDEGREVQYLFASFDVHLKLTTRLLLHIAKSGTSGDQIAQQLMQWWSPKDAGRIADAIKAHLVRINSSSHVPKTVDDPDYISKMIEVGERQLTVRPI